MLLNRSVLTCDIYSVNQKKWKAFLLFTFYEFCTKKNLFKDRNTKIGVAGFLILLKLDLKLTEIWENLLWISMGFGSAE